MTEENKIKKILACVFQLRKSFIEEYGKYPTTIIIHPYILSALVYEENYYCSNYTDISSIFFGMDIIECPHIGEDEIRVCITKTVKINV